MTYAQLFAMIKDAGLSGEEAARRLGISHMTLHRWRARPGHRRVDPIYERSFETSAYEWISEGLLPVTAPTARALFARPGTQAFTAALRNLGLTTDSLAGPAGDTGVMVEALTRIGQSAEVRGEVDGNLDHLAEYGKQGEDWRDRLRAMLAVVRSGHLSLTDKLVAYGSLFYLLTPFDLIPDLVPGFGLLDDFAVLGLATAFYARRFPSLIQSTER